MKRANVYLDRRRTLGERLVPRKIESGKHLQVWLISDQNGWTRRIERKRRRDARHLNPVFVRKRRPAAMSQCPRVDPQLDGARGGLDQEDSGMGPGCRKK